MGKKGISKYSGFFTKGQKFGKYEIMNEELIFENDVKILCKCECGNVNKVSCWTLEIGKSKGCLECNNPRPKEKNPSWRGFENISGKYFGRISRFAIKRDIPFDISIEYMNLVLVQQEFKCNLSKLPIYFSSSKKNNYEATASIDRIDSDKGYVVDNIQWIHKDINLMKNHFDQNYFFEICEKITNERRQRKTN
jgi:hypothetical protein